MGVIMKIVFVLVSCLLFFSLTFSQNHPTYSELDLPVTRFSCEDKVNGGYYADMDTECQMYHVCHRDKEGRIRGTRFLCGNGTVFDQRHLVCQDYRKVMRRCRQSARHYNNVATLLERLEHSLMTEETEKEISDVQNFESGRLK